MTVPVWLAAPEVVAVVAVAALAALEAAAGLFWVFNRTVSIKWTTPLATRMLGVTTFAVDPADVTNTPVEFTVNEKGSPPAETAVVPLEIKEE